MTQAEVLPVSDPVMPARDAVAFFLRAHPDFLAHQPDLYRALNPPVRVYGDRVADHMAAMIAAERRRLRAVEFELLATVSTRPADFILTTRIRLSVIALMRTSDVAEAVNEELPALLRLATCSLLSEAPDRRGVRRLPHGAVARLLGHGRDAVVRTTPSEVELLHGPAATLVTRDALVLVPIWNNQPTLLVLGARDPSAIPAKQATGALAFLGRAVGAAMTR